MPPQNSERWLTFIAGLSTVYPHVDVRLAGSPRWVFTGVGLMGRADERAV